MDNIKNPLQFGEFKIIYDHELSNHKVTEGWYVLQFIKESRGSYQQDSVQKNNSFHTKTVYTGQNDTIKLLMGRTINGAQIYG